MDRHYNSLLNVRPQKSTVVLPGAIVGNHRSDVQSPVLSFVGRKFSYIVLLLTQLFRGLNVNGEIKIIYVCIYCNCSNYR